MMMTLAAVLCCVMLTTVFTSCKKDSDFQSYSIVVTPGGILTGDAAVNWTNQTMNAYQAALDIDAQSFTMDGTAEECNKHVIECCKKAEVTVNRLGGAGEVKVLNFTANRYIYVHQY